MSFWRFAICAVLFAISMTSLLVGRAEAQGGYGRGMGRHGGEDRSQERRPSEDPGADIAKRFQDMAATKADLKDVKLDHAQKDSIGRIEKTYQNRFLSYSIAARHLFEDAKAQGTAPDPQQLEQLGQDARKLQDQEYGELRAVISDDQRATFDANVRRERGEEQKSEPAGDRRGP